MNLPSVQFTAITPCSAEQLGENVQSALKRNLLPLDQGPIRTLHVIANGPSAKSAPLLALQAQGASTLALNGALSLFTGLGLAPTFWAACDPQPLVADFLPAKPPKDTIYAVASKCDPSVFNKLAFRTVRLWHTADHELSRPHRSVKVASSVTLCALSQFRRLGYRHFEMYGWDGCYLDGEHHANEPKTEPKDGDIDLIVGATQDDEGQMTGGKLFHTNTTWAMEAQDAVIQLHHADYSVNIHGEGLIAAMMEGRQ